MEKGGSINKRLSAIQLASLDGSASYPRLRQEQLSIIYNVLSVGRDTIISAINADRSGAPAEAEVELVQVLQHVQACYEQVKLDFSLTINVQSGEQIVEKGKGLICVVVDTTAPLASLVIPLASALLFGNCVVAMLSETTPSFNFAIQALFSELNHSVFAAIAPGHSVAFEKILSLEPAVVIAPKAFQSKSIPSTVSFVTNGPQPTVVVDREQKSQLAKIARLVVRGKFFGLGRLPGSVGRLLVQEEVAAELVELMVSEIQLGYGSDPSVSGDLQSCSDSGLVGEWASLVREEAAHGTGKVLCGGSSSGSFFPPTVVENASRTLLKNGSPGPILPLTTFSGLEGALTILQDIGEETLYLFASRGNAAYLAQESKAATVYLDDIPLSALLTPNPALVAASTYVSSTNVIGKRTSKVAPFSDSFFAPFSSAKMSILRKGVFITLGTVLSVILGLGGWGSWKAFGWLRRYYLKW